MNADRHFRMETDDRGVVTVTIDVEGQSVNVFDAEVLAELEEIVGRLESMSGAKAVLFRSGKESGFLAGADVKQIAALDDADDVCEVIRRGQTLFDRVEKLPMPTVAVIHGSCLGGGLEFALACRHRIARNDASTRLGLPEIKLGLLPAWGGTQRLPRLIGVVPALSMILQGKQVPAAKALKRGLLDLTPAPEKFDAGVERFLSRLTKGETVDRGQRRSFSAWLLNGTRFGRWLAFRTTARRIAPQVQNYPALGEALSAVRTGYRESMAAGLDYEREAFARLLFTPTCRSLLELFFQRERSRRVETWIGGGEAPHWEGEAPAEPMSRISDERPAQRELCSPNRIGVVGAGAMGAGIAQLAAYQGLDVVLKEIDEAALDAGMSRIHTLFDDAVRGGRLSRAEADERMSAITPTIDWQPLERVDLVVEAVVERVEVKQEVFAELERWLPEGALLASNTSSLSIGELSRSLQRPERLAGLHFFNPVHRMELVEVVRTPETSEATIEALVRLVKRLGKTPMVVNDSPGFLVNRVLFPYLAEAVRMVGEGADVETIDRTMRRFGMPMGPLELLDQVGLDVAAHVAKSLSPEAGEEDITALRLSSMVERGHLGKKSGRGFYEYQKGRRTRAAENDFTPQASGGRKPPVANDEAPAHESGSVDHIQTRLVLAMVNEAARCLEEGVVDAAWKVDLAMVLGTGFAPFRGGPLRMADGRGSRRIVDELNELSRQCGERFSPCELIVELAAGGARFYEKDLAGTATGKSTAADVVRSS